MEVPDKLKRLVARFDEQKADYLAGKYNETLVRRDFIDPFLSCLGWDVGNVAGRAERYREVVHEDSIKIEGRSKAPDYSLRIGGQRKLFVEAKKPSVNIKTAQSPAFQIRRYAWSAKLPLSILTDFEEFAVYDCRDKPDLTDQATHGRILYITYDQYEEKWEELVALFSPQAIMGGSLDQYVQKNKAKRGTAAVDDAFLAEISAWRDQLARNVALRNGGIGTRELNQAVQRTIDRIIFLRIAEDRAIEPYGRLRDLSERDGVYRELIRLFRQADKRYNSGLFYFKQEKGRESEQPDQFTLELTIDDSVLKQIIKRLYYPHSPYQFDVISADILGQVYEQFLGKVIRLTKAGSATVEDKPEVKKAGGVFYTPTYIVDYIVQGTVGKLVAGKTPKQVETIRIVDPACGSGSFLLGAYQFLLDWHEAQYNDDVARWSRGRDPRLVQTANGAWRLTINERKRILLNNIFGVDIDTQAVEVTKLSLLLKVMEGETDASLGAQLSLVQERVLPSLSANIQCGNSLIGSDFYDVGQIAIEMFDEEEMFRINVFDWDMAFPDVMKNGGFDAVIGNPPWISLTGKFGNDILSQDELDWLIERYKGNTYMPNMYEYFISRALSLVRPKGLFSFVVPDRFGFNNQFVELRQLVLSKFSIKTLMYEVPFPQITADVLVFVFGNEVSDGSNLMSVSEFEREPIQIPQNRYSEHPKYVFDHFEDAETIQIVTKIEDCEIVRRLGDIFDTTSGFGGKSQLVYPEKLTDEQIQVLKGDSIQRYKIRKSYWFEFKKENITGRTTNKKKLGATPKILLRKTGDSIIATYDESGIFPEQSLYFLFNNRSKLDFKYFLGVLNSKLMGYYYATSALTNKKSIAQVKKQDLDELPFAIPTSGDGEKNAIEIAKLVQRMLDLNTRLTAAQTTHERTLLTRRIAATDRQINQLVYTLYGLTDEEIGLVEG